MDLLVLDDILAEAGTARLDDHVRDRAISGDGVCRSGASARNGVGAFDRGAFFRSQGRGLDHVDVSVAVRIEPASMLRGE
jgi:hypothetical protein